MKKIPLLAACLFILLLCLPGYANDPHFRHYNNKQGLSHNTVYCSLQDQRGFMWFGTEDGLNRFDGHTFKIYRHNSYNPNSLPNDCIVNLLKVPTKRYGFLQPEELVTTITGRIHSIRSGYRPDKMSPNHFLPVRKTKTGISGLSTITGLSAIIRQTAVHELIRQKNFSIRLLLP